MEFAALADQISRTDPTDRMGMAEIHQSLKAARERTSALSPEVRCRINAAVRLTDLLSRASDPTTPEDLRVLVELLQPEFVAPEEDADRPPGSDLRLMSDMLLGDVLLQLRTITRGQLEDGLRLQLRRHEALGKCLVRNGVITETQLEKALDFQARLRTDPLKSRELDMGQPPTPEKVERGLSPYHEVVSECLLGEILIRLGKITEEELERALKVQRATGMRVGEALVDIGVLDWAQIERALEIQYQRRKR